MEHENQTERKEESIIPSEISSSREISEQTKEILLPLEMKRKPHESQASYLHRAGEQISTLLKKQKGKLVDIGRMRESDYSEEIKTLITNVIKEASFEQEIPERQKENELVLSEIEKITGSHDRGKFNSSESFDTTQRNRKFFDIQTGTGAASRETYWNTLFFPFNTKETRAFAKKILEGKRIVLLGGGRAKLKEEFEQQGIQTADVINADPFVENPEQGADRVIPVSASDTTFTTTIQEQGIDQADEIWAEFSVPAYLDDPKEIRQLIVNIDSLLADNGTARIWPLLVDGDGTPEELILRKQALCEALKEITSKKKYEVTLYKAMGQFGFTLKRLQPTRQEQQQSQDQRKSNLIREKLGLTIE